MPRPIAATPRREPLTMLIIRLNPRASEESVLGLLRMYASVSTKSTSAVGTERVPSLSLIRLMRMLLGVPSARVAGTRKRARPRRPGSAPSGRAGGGGGLGAPVGENHFEALSSQRLGHQLLADARRGVSVDERHDAVRHAGGADHSGVGLAEEIGEGAGEDGWHLLALRLQGVRALLPDVALGVDGAGVVRHARRFVAPGVVLLQARRGAVDNLGVGGDGPAADLAPAAETLLRPAAVLRREGLVHQRAQVRVDLVPVEADGGFELGVIDGCSHGAPRRVSFCPASLAGAAG